MWYHVPGEKLHRGQRTFVLNTAEIHKRHELVDAYNTIHVLDSSNYLLRCPFDRREVQNLENAMTLAPGPFVTLGTDRGYVQRRMRLLQRARKDRQLVDLGEASRVAQVFRLPGRANNFYAFFEPHSA